MKREDILYSCKLFSEIIGIPFRIYRNKTHLKSFRIDEFSEDPLAPFINDILALDSKVSCYVTSFDSFYGTISHNDFQIIVGPMGKFDYTTQNQQAYAFRLDIDIRKFTSIENKPEQLTNCLVENMIQLLLMLNFHFNKQKLELMDLKKLFKINTEKPVTNSESNSLELSTKESALSPIHNSLAYETELLALVASGNTIELQKFISSTMHGNVGVLSEENIRNYKNIFVVSTTLASRAAISGGLFEDEAMELSDTYIKNCEKLHSVDSILKLQLQMVMDYTERVSKMQTKLIVSPFISEVVAYIKQNISERLDTTSIANHFFINRNLLSKKFKEELGLTPTSFILNERINRAKFLLENSDRSIVEISNYLGFSSQSHFHTKFKQLTGVTPNNYRTSISNRVKVSQ